MFSRGNRRMLFYCRKLFEANAVFFGPFLRSRKEDISYRVQNVYRAVVRMMAELTGRRQEWLEMIKFCAEITGHEIKTLIDH